MRKGTAWLTAFLLVLCVCAQSAADKVITLTFAGDCTLGSEEIAKRNTDSFESCVKQNGYDYFFANYYDLFSKDDCTVVNCECVFSDSSDWEVTSKSFRFRAAEDYVNIFKAGSVEAVSLANNHTMDYSEQGLNNTKRVLDEAGIGWAWDECVWVFKKDGIGIGFAAIDYGIYQRSNYLVRDKLLQLRESGEINAAVLLVHQGNEYSPVHIPEQDLYAEYFIENAEVDLVITSHPHVLQGIRILNNRTVFYSLGNFIFGGHNKVSKGNGTDSLYTMAVQAKFYFTDEGEYKGQQITIYPGYDSGKDPVNNYQPVRVDAQQAEAVMNAIQQDTAFELPQIRTDANGLSYVVMDYLPADKNAPPQRTNGEPEPAEPRPSRNR